MSMSDDVASKEQSVSLVQVLSPCVDTGLSHDGAASLEWRAEAHHHIDDALGGDELPHPI